MNMNLLLECNWQVVINHILWFCIFLLIIVAYLIWFYLKLKYLEKPNNLYAHEKEMKKMVFEHEMIWDIQKKSVATSEHEIEELLIRKKQLEVEIKTMESQIEKLKKQIQLYT